MPCRPAKKGHRSFAARSEPGEGAQRFSNGPPETLVTRKGMKHPDNPARPAMRPFPCEIACRRAEKSARSSQRLPLLSVFALPRFSILEAAPGYIRY